MNLSKQIIYNLNNPYRNNLDVEYKATYDDEELNISIIFLDLSKPIVFGTNIRIKKNDIITPTISIQLMYKKLAKSIISMISNKTVSMGNHQTKNIILDIDISFNESENTYGNIEIKYNILQNAIKQDFKLIEMSSLSNLTLVHYINRITSYKDHIINELKSKNIPNENINKSVWFV